MTYQEKHRPTPVELKPCPFCGGEGTVFQIPENNGEEKRLHLKWDWNCPGKFVIGCWTEMCMGNINNMAMIFTTEESAVKAWNRRSKRKNDCKGIMD